MPALRSLITSLAWLLCCASHAAESYSISYVYDGDTVQLKSAEEKFKLRLTDIDAPERNQSYGLKARRALMKLCQSTHQGTHIEVKVEMTGTDQYARQLGKLNCNGTDASYYLVKKGLAWHSSRFSRDPILKQAAEQARSQQLGLWQDPDPIPPWVWRKRNLQTQSNN